MRRLDRVEIGDRNLVKADDLRAEALQIFRLPARGERRERAPVEGAFEGEDVEALGMAGDGVALARHLDRRLVGLRAGICEKYEIGEGRVAEAARKPLAFRHLEQIRSVPDLRALGHQGIDEVRMRMPQRGDGDAGPEIQVALARRRRQPATVAPLKGDVGPRIGGYDCG